MIFTFLAKFVLNNMNLAKHHYYDSNSDISIKYRCKNLKHQSCSQTTTLISKVNE